jgi:hypothetical protein
MWKEEQKWYKLSLEKLPDIANFHHPRRELREIEIKRVWSFSGRKLESIVLTKIHALSRKKDRSGRRNNLKDIIFHQNIWMRYRPDAKSPIF